VLAGGCRARRGVCYMHLSEGGAARRRRSHDRYSLSRSTRISGVRRACALAVPCEVYQRESRFAPARAADLMVVCCRWFLPSFFGFEVFARFNELWDRSGPIRAPPDIAGWSAEHANRKIETVAHCFVLNRPMKPMAPSNSSKARIRLPVCDVKSAMPLGRVECCSRLLPLAKRLFRL
jgi:hypothetical protein